jgi:hypothetical protein
MIYVIALLSSEETVCVHDLPQFVFGVLQQLRQDLLAALIFGRREHVTVMRYGHAKPFDVTWQAGDKFGLLCKLQGTFSDVSTLHRV